MSTDASLLVSDRCRPRVDGTAERSKPTKAAGRSHDLSAAKPVKNAPHLGKVLVIGDLRRLPPIPAGRCKSWYGAFIGREPPWTTDRRAIRWIKSSASSGNGACVEVASVREDEDPRPQQPGPRGSHPVLHQSRVGCLPRRCEGRRVRRDRLKPSRLRPFRRRVSPRVRSIERVSSEKPLVSESASAATDAGGRGLPSAHAFQVDLRGIVDLLSHHLYSSPRVFVRELAAERRGRDHRSAG